MALKQNTWTLNQWYDQDVAGNVSYSTTSNELWTWGDNASGELGQNNTTRYSSPVQIPGTNWARVGIRDTKVAGLKTDGTLWMWGYNEFGQLGQNNTTQYSSPVQIPGTTWSSDWGKLSGTAYAVTGAVKTDGTLWIWGYNAKGQLGQNNTTNYSSPKQVPGTTWNIYSNSYEGSYAIKTDGTLWSWGRNNNSTNSGILGHNNKTQYSSPKQIPGTTWATIVAAAGFMMATKTDNTLWTWGSNAYGALGMDNNTLANTRYSSPVQVGTDSTWSTSYNQLCTNPSHSVATIKTDGTLWTWGQNQHGELGQNNKTQYSSPKQVGSGTDWDTVQTKHPFMIARKTDGTVWIWGENEKGSLGLNEASPGTQYSSPIQIPGFTAGEFSNIGVNKDGGNVLKEL